MGDARLVILYSSTDRHPAGGATGHAQAPELDIVSIARAIAASPIWSRMHRATVVVRANPDPTLAVLGEFDAADLARLEGLRHCLQEHLTRLRYVTYPGAESAAERLAGRLVELLGPDWLKRARYAAIARGGFFVLGMLAYALDLDAASLEAGDAVDSPLVVVDDCAYTGNRFARYLAKVPEREVVFAHLFSHPDLRSAIESREPRVLAAVAADDLRDFAPEVHGAGYDTWRECAFSFNPRPSYWTGQTERVCFPWGEPDYNFWNPQTQAMESGWFLVGPTLSLKTRAFLCHRTMPVYEQPFAGGQFRPGPNVLFAPVGDELAVGNPDDHTMVLLDPVASRMWTTLLECADIDDAVRQLSVPFAGDPGTIRRDLEDLVDELSTRGLLSILHGEV